MHTVYRGGNLRVCGEELCANHLVTLVVYLDKREGGSLE